VGIGLFLCCEISEVHKGSISCKPSGVRHTNCANPLQSGPGCLQAGSWKGPEQYGLFLFAGCVVTRR
jgi:hypothetical protein